MVGRKQVAGGIASLVVLGAVAACDDVLVQGPSADVGNVVVTLGAAVVESDTAVVVDGRTLVRHPSNGQALWVDRFERFEHGGFPEHDYVQEQRYSTAWRVLLTHGHPPETRGDSTVFRFVDHGDVAVNGVAMERLTDVPHVPPGATVRFDNFIRYHAPSFVYSDWQSGGSTTFVQAPFHADLVNGLALTIETTGSAEADPTAGTFSVRPFAALVRMENDSPLDLHDAMPTIHTDQSLVFVFDRPLDPERAFIILVPFEDRPGLTRALIQPHSPTRRVVLPPHVLRQLVQNPGHEAVAFRAIVVEVLVHDDVLSGHLTGGGPNAREFGLPLVQRAETSVNLYLR